MKRTHALLGCVLAQLCLLSCPLRAQYASVTSSNMTASDGTLLSNATVTWTPVLLPGAPTLLGAKKGGVGGQLTGLPVQKQVVAGAFQVTVADTVSTVPANFCYHVTVQDNASGSTLLDYPCVQPGGNTTQGYWCTQQPGGMFGCNLDLYSPNYAPQAVLQPGLPGPAGPAGPQGPAGPAGGISTTNPTFSSVTVNGGYAGFTDWVAGSAPPAQTANSFRLQAPTNIPTSFLGIWPASPPTSASCLMMPAGGGQMVWGLCSGSGGGSSLSTANIWTAVQTFSAGLQAGSSSGWHVVDLGNGYTSMTFNTSDADTTRVGFVGSPGDPNLYADFQGKLNFRHASTSTSSFLDGNGFNGGVGQTTLAPGSFTNLYASGSLNVAGSFTNGPLHFVAVGAGYSSLSINGNDTDGGREGLVGRSGDPILNWDAPGRHRFRINGTTEQAAVDSGGFEGPIGATLPSGGTFSSLAVNFAATASTTASNYSIPINVSGTVMYLRLSSTP